jgi:hypothetical protein
VFALHETDRISHHAQSDEVVAPLSFYDDPDNSSSPLAECLDGSQYVAVIQV